MNASVQDNLPRWSGRGFEIWFFVVLVPDVRRALWVRFTRFADGDASDARVWAVLSRPEAITQERQVFPLDALQVQDGPRDFHLSLGEAHLGASFSRGQCGTIAWDLQIDARPPVHRVPKPPWFVPVGTHATHPHAEAPVKGWVESAGQRWSLDGGLSTQMHIWGHKRVESLRWLWVPRFAEGGALELTAVAPKLARGPSVCALWAQTQDVLDNTGLIRSLRARVHSPGPGVLHHVGTRGGQRCVVRGWAPTETFAGWDYRQTGPALQDLPVSQSNLAHCEMELYRKQGLSWIPQRRYHSTCAALEVHGGEALDGVSYVPWGPSDAPAPRRAPGVASESPPRPGQWLPTPSPTQIVALGLSYREHAREIGGAPDPVVFPIAPSAWTAGDGDLIRPASHRLLALLASLDPALPEALSHFGFIPAMLDYEVELGLVLLDGLEAAAHLDALAKSGSVGLVVANDLTARSVQILGEGQADRLAYWSAAKSLEGYVPTTARCWVPPRFDLDAWPDLTLETRVNGELRQRANLRQLIETPRQLLSRLCETTGPLAPGTLILTGTPGGVALSVPRWKRALGDRFLTRVGKLQAALGGFSASQEFLRPGDVVEVQGGFLGSVRRRVRAEPEAHA